MISKRQLASSTVVRYTDIAQLADLFKEDIKLFTQPSVKSPHKLLGLSRLGAWDEAIVNRLQAESTDKNMCKTTKCNDVICIP